MKGKRGRTSLAHAAKLLEDAEKLGTIDPTAALPKLEEALEACRRAGVPCLATRALAGIGWASVTTGELGKAEEVFQDAYRSECPYCRPIIDRRYARFLDYLGRMAEAEEYALRALEDCPEGQRGFALTTLGLVRYHAENYSGSAEAHSEALATIPVDSPHHLIAQANLADALRKSGKLEDVRRAERIYRGLPEAFLGMKRLTVARAKVAWGFAEMLALIAHLDPDLRPWERKQLLREARHHLTPAVQWLTKKRLFLDAAAAQSDLAAIKMQLAPLEVLDTLKGIPAKGQQEGSPYDVSQVLIAAKAAADVVFSLDRKEKLWETLRDLRQALVNAGAAEPVMIYADY